MLAALTTYTRANAAFVPDAGANPRSGTAAGTHAATMIGMIFGRFRWAAEA
jgi:hypothetical protein